MNLRLRARVQPVAPERATAQARRASPACRSRSAACPTAWRRRCWPASTRCIGLYASFAGPIAGGLSSSTQLMVITTTSAAALTAGSTLVDVALRRPAAGAGAADAHGRRHHDRRRAAQARPLHPVRLDLGDDRLPHRRRDQHRARPARRTSPAPRCRGVDRDRQGLGPGHAPSRISRRRPPWGCRRSRSSPCGPHPAAAVRGGVRAGDPDRRRRSAWTASSASPTTGAIPTGVPLPHMPDLSVFSFDLLAGAAAIAVLVLVQGAGVAESAPNPDGKPSRIDRDFLAAGIGNLASAIFRGQPVGGSVGQTALNLAAGARSRWAGIFAGMWMLAILVAFSGIVGKVRHPDPVGHPHLRRRALDPGAARSAPSCAPERSPRSRSRPRSCRPCFCRSPRRWGSAWRCR